MAAEKQDQGIECRECGGTNTRGSKYCWYCGARLPRVHLGLLGGTTYIRVAAQVIKWLFSLGVIAAIAYALYYTAERLVFPLFASNTTETAYTVPSTTPYVEETSTTTTTEPLTVNNIPAGEDRYATAIAVSQLNFPTGAPSVVLVSGESYEHGICVPPLAAAYGGPVLLMPPSGLRGDLESELRMLDPVQVFLVGVPKAKTTASRLREILDKPQVTTITGDDAYQTAVLIAETLAAKLETIARVVVVPSDDFVEAVAVGPLASAHKWPLVLTRRDAKLPARVTSFLEQTGVTSALIVGTQTKLSLATVETINETDPFTTAAAVVSYASRNGLSFAHTCIASGDSFADALVASACLAQDNGILLLAKNGELPTGFASLFETNRSEIRTLDIIGLPALTKKLSGTTPQTTP